MCDPATRRGINREIDEVVEKLRRVSKSYRDLHDFNRATLAFKLSLDVVALKGEPR